MIRHRDYFLTPAETGENYKRMTKEWGTAKCDSKITIETHKSRTRSMNSAANRNVRVKCTTSASPCLWLKLPPLI